MNGEQQMAVRSRGACLMDITAQHRLLINGLYRPIGSKCLVLMRLI